MILEAGIKSAIIGRIPKDQRETVLRITIARIGVLVGIKNLPDDDTIRILLDFILEYHPWITMDELYMSAEMNLAGLFPTKVEHYGLIGTDYLSCLIGYFKGSKEKAVNIAKMLLPPPPPEPLPEDRTMYEGLLNISRSTGSIPEHWDFIGAYRHLLRSGLITDTIQEKQELRNEVEDIIQGEMEDIKRRGTFRMIQGQLQEMQSETYIRFRCQKEYVRRKIMEEMME